jgi:Mrp family chromosome partitioning ATPase
MAAKTTLGAPNHAPAGTQSAAGFLERLRRTLAPETAEPPEPQGRWLERLRRAQPEEDATPAPRRAGPLPIGGNMPVLRTNDLRAYLNQRLAAAAEAADNSARNKNAPAPKPSSDKVGPVLKSLDAVLNHVLAAGQGSAPRALLVGAASPKLDATAEAISIARALVARREQVVLVDLARGSASISGALGLPRTPGLTELSAGRAGFEDVVGLDGETALQLIPAGNPKLAGSGDENGRFARVLEALTQAYDSVVFHSDREALHKLTHGLRFELPIVVAVLAAGTSESGAKTDFSAFSALGCPILVYEQNGKGRRSRFL